MFSCRGKCLYFKDAYKFFANGRTHKTHKYCTVCKLIVPRDKYPGIKCLCCSSRYRVVPKLVKEEDKLYVQ